MDRILPAVGYLAVSVVIGSVGCTTHVSIKLEESTPAATEPSQRAIQPYSRDGNQRPEPVSLVGDTIVVDSPNEAPRQSHHSGRLPFNALKLTVHPVTALD